MGTLRRNRPGFTLIELLVVMAIISFLAALLVLLGPGLLKSEKAARGAQTLQGILFVAKQQALRDRNPYGIRLLQDNDTQVRSFQYIQQPGDFTGGKVTVTTGSATATFTGVDLTGGLPDPATWPVQKGDFLQAVPSDPYNRIETVTQVSLNPLVCQVTFTYQTYNGSGSSTPTDQYRIARSPRPAPGEDTILLPDDVIVDMGPNRSIITADQRGYFDILFAPSGALQGGVGGAQQGKIILWVRDETQDPNSSSEQTLITIFIRTGQIAAYAVDTGSSDPYSFTRDPRAGGL